VTFEVLVANDIDDVFAIFFMDRFAWEHKCSVLAVGGDGDADIGIREQGVIGILNRGEEFTDVSISARYNCGWDSRHFALPDAAGECVPDDANGFTNLEVTDLGLVDEGSDLHVAEICYIEEEFSGRYVRTLLGGKEVDGPVKWGSNVAIGDQLLGC